MNYPNHITSIDQLTRSWLRPDNSDLKSAMERTVEEGLFSFEDIKFQIRALKQKVDGGQIEEWARRLELSWEKNAMGQKVLCLHAGNLPLVGFQDALGTLLSGAEYNGKLSRKDPYLLRSFLEHVAGRRPDLAIRFDTDLHTFMDLKADKVLFAGSERSVDPVREQLETLRAVHEDTEFVIRTAKFSIAWIPDEDPATITDLVEAVFRYGGQGCRSVAMVVSPLGLNELKCHFQDYIESFWLKNPQHEKPGAALEYQFAYNKAIGRNQAWMQDFLIQESEDIPELDFCLHWVKGDQQKVMELRDAFGSTVQTVYTTGDKIGGLSSDFLSQAQTPDLWWKPDGVGVLEGLIQ